MAVKITRGIRNHNYGNLKKGSSWQGLLGCDLQGFCIFDSDFNGIRALYKLLRTYRKRGWLKDSKTFAHHYCPTSKFGDDEVKYAKFVNRAWLHDIRSHQFAEDLAYLIIVQENGFTPEEIDKYFGRDVVGCLHDLRNFYD